MQRLWILAILACGTMVLSGCGGEKKETADNSSNSDSSSSSSSSRPNRNGGGETKKNQSGDPQGGMQMSGDPERRNGKDPGQDMQKGGGSMRGDPRQMQDPTKGSGPKKPDDISQEEWDSFSPEVKERYGGLMSAGGNKPPPLPTNRMKGDPRQNGGGGGDGNSQTGEMQGDPRQNGGGSGDGNSQTGAMRGDPRGQGGGGGFGGSTPPGGGFGGSSPPGDSRMSGGPGGSGGRGFGPGGRANATPTTLKEKAMKAFEDGDDDGGFQFIHGHYIAEDDGRRSIPLQFMPTIRRPRTAIRWGVGVVVKQNKTFEGDPPIIGEKPNVLPQARNSRTRNGGGFGGPAGSRGSGAPPAGGAGGSGFGGGFGNRNSGKPSNGGMEELKYYTGEVGETVVGMLDKLRVTGQFGKMIAKVNHSGGDGGGNARGGGSGFRGGAGGSSPTLDDGRTGPDPRGGGAGGFSRNNQTKKPSADAASQYKNVLPGVLMLGKSSLKTLSSRAKAHGIELLIVFDVNLKGVPATGQKINETKVSIYDVTGKTPVRVGKPSNTLTNVRVWMAREKNTDEEKDPIRVAVKKIFEPGKEGGFLTVYKMGQMPELNQGHVMKRLKQLIAEGQASGNPMPALVELTYYREKGLLPEKAYVESVNELAGTEIGDTLLNGSEEDRVKAIGSLLPPEWKVNEGAAEGGGGDVL